MTLDADQLERTLKMALAINARLERENLSLRLAPKAVVSENVLKKLSLDLDKDGLERVLRVLKSTVVELRQGRDVLLKGRNARIAKSHEQTACEIILVISMLEEP